jgi:hypothetical protein
VGWPARFLFGQTQSQTLSDMSCVTVSHILTREHSMSFPALGRLSAPCTEHVTGKVTMRSAHKSPFWCVLPISGDRRRASFPHTPPTPTTTDTVYQVVSPLLCVWWDLRFGSSTVWGHGTHSGYTTCTSYTAGGDRRLQSAVPAEGCWREKVCLLSLGNLHFTESSMEQTLLPLP